MPETSRLTWKRFAIEAPVIVISILLAFAIDAWWQDRGERRAELVLLERLRSDFLELRSALKVVEDEHDEARTACLALLQIPAGDAVPETPEFDRMVTLVFLASRTFNPGSGAVASFHGNEEAQLLVNRELADRLLAWSGLVDELQEEEANLQKGVAERWSPFIASRVSLGPYLRGAGEPGADIPAHIVAPESRQALIVDATFTNHVLDRFKWQQLALRDIGPVQSAVAEILELIEAELGNRDM